MGSLALSRALLSITFFIGAVAHLFSKQILKDTKTVIVFVILLKTRYLTKRRSKRVHPTVKC